ncbi:hypothetical protein D3C71_1687330 [compost metagenome]
MFSLLLYKRHLEFWRDLQEIFLRPLEDITLTPKSAPPETPGYDTEPTEPKNPEQR